MPSIDPIRFERFDPEEKFTFYTSKRWLDTYSRLVEEHTDRRPDHRAIVATFPSGEWECLYIDGNLTREGHTIQEGLDRGMFFLTLCERHGLTRTDFHFVTFTEEFEEVINETGSVPTDLNQVKQYFQKS